ncbi:MAG: DUF2235 domain-containing protein [Litoreibacter sp.]|uniref:DUF2235 domain-containing protein n=1 Tax=Litoreibacter sp. TaxID=1969459 RepID=UPI00329A4A54
MVGFGPMPQSVHPKGPRGPVTHVIILDGTMSSMDRGFETHAGTTFRMLSEMAPNKALSLNYQAGIQWQGLRHVIDVMAGVGINRQIRTAYGFIASRYRPGDRIFLFGYSRGAYAVRSLAGVIDQVGLLRAEDATERNVRQAYRHYRRSRGSDAAREFRKQFCHDDANIEMIGIWDTVRALGFRAPLLWRFSPVEHEFHDHALGCSVKHGYHALALNETRQIFEPVLWKSREGYKGVLEQVWFKGAHGDIGGHLMGYNKSRPLANIPLVWMLEKAEDCGLPLPDGWRARFPRDVDAPSVGTWRQWGKLFWQRRARVVGQDPSESLHGSVAKGPQAFVPATKSQMKKAASRN